MMLNRYTMAGVVHSHITLRFMDGKKGAPVQPKSTEDGRAETSLVFAAQLESPHKTIHHMGAPVSPGKRRKGQGTPQRPMTPMGPHVFHSSGITGHPLMRLLRTDHRHYSSF
eukprot:1161266-Pelagomonas_calceolata.AAC.5